jgi:pantetheine-phosphate adenylyltransferase
MHVQQILKSKADDTVVTIIPGASVREAAELLSARRIGSLVVSLGDSRIAGILSERDIVRELGRRGPACLSDRVDDLMTRDIVTCGVGDSTDEVLRKMTDGRFRHMPVVKDGRMVGLIYRRRGQGTAGRAFDGKRRAGRHDHGPLSPAPPCIAFRNIVAWPKRGKGTVMRIGLYPGTFDPVTLGHIDIIQRASTLVDRLVIGVAINRDKGPLFTLEERVAMVEAECAKLAVPGGPEFVVHPFENLLIDCAHDVNATMIIRGLRAVADFEYEFQMVGMNRVLDASVETVFLMADARRQAIASKLVKEIARLGGDVSKFVPEAVNAKLLAKFA